MGLSASKRHACALTFEVFVRLELSPPPETALWEVKRSALTSPEWIPREGSEHGAREGLKMPWWGPVWALATFV